MRLTRIGAAFTLTMSLATPQAPGADLIPRSDFFGNPERATVRISPDGTQLSFLAEHRGVMNVWVQTIGAEDARPVTTASGHPVESYFWAANGGQILYVEPSPADAAAHLFSVDLATYDVVDLTPFPGVRASVIAIDRNHPDEVLVGVNRREPTQVDVLRVNTRSGERELSFLNREGYIGLQADSDFQVRLAARINKTGGLDIITRDGPHDPWYELVRWSLEDAATSRSLGFSRDGGTIYLVDSRDADTGRLYGYSVGRDGEGGAYELMAYDERVDAGTVLFDPANGRPQAVSFDYERRNWQILDESIRDDCAYLARVTDGELSIISRDDSDRRWVVAYERDDGPRSYYLYDRDSRGETLLFTDRPSLEGAVLAPMQPLVIRARDGLGMVSYLTLPAGHSYTDESARDDGLLPAASTIPAPGLPMVLYVHGGPWSRDTWGYNAVHQWLANRGYAVLSVNFRGSSGFGKRFQNAGNGEWAGRMQDDLVDAVIWAVDRGIAHPDQVAIMGGSYGGYATLVGLSFTPDFFAAGVDIVGPSNVRTLLESIPPHWAPLRAMYEARIGPLDTPEYLDLISPISRAEEIRRPLLIGHGRRDRRVKESETLQIVDTMQRNGVPVTCIVFPDEGHGFARAENALAFFAVAEKFLARHLGGRFEPIGDSIEASSAEIQAGAELISGLTGN